eukprot:6871244-Prymnesium_polylepis.1
MIVASGTPSGAASSPGAKANALRRMWGPLSLEAARRFGAHAPVSSVVVMPELEAGLLAEVPRGDSWRN